MLQSRRTAPDRQRSWTHRQTRAGLEAGGAERAISGSALGRVGEPEDVAETVAFLVSDAARQITGATIDVNGGYLMI